MNDFPRPCSRCGAEGLWEFENHAGLGPRYLCPTCVPVFVANAERNRADEAAFDAHAKAHSMLFASPSARDRAKTAWLKRARR